MSGDWMTIKLFYNVYLLLKSNYISIFFKNIFSKKFMIDNIDCPS